MDENQKSQKDIMLPGSIIVAALLIAGAVVYSTGSDSVRGDDVIVVPLGDEQHGGQPALMADVAGLIEDDVILGDPNAPVTIVEFGDYQCPFCGRFFSETEPLIIENYVKTGKAKLVYRDFPFLGPESQGAALASQCAAEQGSFWAYHDRLFETEIADGREHNGNLNEILFYSLAEELGLDSRQFDSCFQSQKYRAEIEKDYNDGVAAGVRGTPATFVNGQLVSGAVPYSHFQTLIEQALAQ